MADEVLVRVENVSKKYCRSLKRSMLYGVEDIARDILHLPSQSSRLRKEEFWAVQDVSFELRRGECLGIIGPNGAGKSTLLKMLNGIILPDKGRITVRGKVGALIEVGAGFHPMLTGRENIYISGAILGLSKKEIDKKFDEIVAFAELEEFIDTPVKHYSSGMYVRLGFSIAAHLDVDVLLVDEVLAVGDAGFRGKSLNIMLELMKRSAVVLVSHNLPDVYRVSNQVVVLNKGRKMYGGSNIQYGIQLYHSVFPVQTKCFYSGYASIEKLDLYEKTIPYGGRIRIRVLIRLQDKRWWNNRADRLDVFLNFYNLSNQLVAQCSSFYNGYDVSFNCGDVVAVIVCLDNIVLNQGKYYIEAGLTLHGHGALIFRKMPMAEVYVESHHHSYASVIMAGKWSDESVGKHNKSFKKTVAAE